MKSINKIFSLFVIVATLWSCADDEKNVNLSDVQAPSALAMAFDVTQDNTGLVTITPTAEGAITFDIALGDDTPEAVEVENGQNTSHTYAEGTYTVTATAYGITGLSTSLSQELVISFQAPENLEVTIENDAAVSKQVNVTVNADYAITFDVYSGETGVTTPVSANIGETAIVQYSDAGIYDITIEVKGAAIQTTTYIEEDFEVTEILAPIAAAPTPPARQPQDVISIFSSAYSNVAGTNYFPDWGQGGQGSSWTMFDLAGDEMLQYINLSYQGIALADGTTVDVSNMEYLHLDVWTSENGDITDLETSIINNAGGTVTEAPVTTSLNAGQWTSLEIPISDYTDQGLTVSDIFQLKFVGTPWAAGTVFIDNIYFYKSPSAPSPLVGTWHIASEVGSLAVGPSQGAADWWSIDAAGLTARACYFDDTYVFGADGSFTNVLGSETWLEAWQGVAADGCGTPIAPHDGTNPATYVHNETAGTVTITGDGAYLGLPKVHNTAEDGNPVNDTITYLVDLIDANTAIIDIEVGSGVWWRYKLVKDGVASSPLTGIWQVASEVGSLAVGPSQGAADWWSIDAAGLTARACYFDDTYVFGADGSFTNVLGSETWLEAWQGVAADGCGTPIAPHDGTNPATYVHNETAGTVTITGDGAYLGLPKVHNTAEDGNPVNDTITYLVDLIDANTAIIDIEVGSGVWWRYKLVKN